MSDRVGLKTKDNAAKKFSSLNLNQTYKGTKVESKASTGAPRHGLQSLGKVATSRRMPPPANLPSLKSENLGNDPTVALVPSGGGGWGSGKDKEASTTTTTTNKNASQGQATPAQPQAQQPSKAIDTSEKATTGQQTNTGQTTSTNQTSATTKTWASSSSSVAGGQEKTSYPHQSQYFNQEFPTLGGGNSKDKLPEERASHPPYGQPPRNMHEPPWMDKGGTGSPPPKSSFAMYNGAPYPGPPPRSGYGPQIYHRDGHPMNSHSQDFPYMGQSRPPNYATHPAANQRGHPGSRITAQMAAKHMVKLEDSPSGYVRPSVVNEEDIRAMDSEDVEDGGWAGAQEEIDYSVKLNFDDDEPHSPGETKPTGPVTEASRQRERVVNGDTNRTQVDGKRPLEPRRQAWAVPAEGHFQPQWNDPPKQGPYNTQGQYNSQRQWAGHFPPPQQRNAFPMGPPPGPQSPPGGRQQPQDQSRTGPTSANKPSSERSVSIEQARQRKLMEEDERKKQQEAASREKLRLLDARTRPVHIQTHEASVREQTGPRSPVSPAGSDAPVRRIMRRKDSGSIGDDDGSSVKSVESVGKEEKKVPENKNQINKPRELRKTSSSDLQEERKSPALKTNDGERIDHQEKDKIERKSAVTKDAKETSTEKSKVAGDFTMQKHGGNREAAKLPTVAGRDIKKHVEDKEKRPERKSSESRPRSDEAFRKKILSETDELHDTADSESRKENLDKRGSRLSSKSDRGSSESVRSRDSIEKRKEDRRRPEDIKRKREDFERNEQPLNEQGNRAPNRDRLFSGRGRGTLGGKSHLRGHPKSYSHGRMDRTTTQRRTRTRNDSKDYADDEIKTVAAEEKGRVNEKTEERHWVGGDRREPGNDRSVRRQNDGNRRQPDSDRRQRDDDRRQQDDSQQSNTEKRRRDGDRRNVEREKREPDDDKQQQTGDRRKKENPESRFYASGRQNERNTRERDPRDDRSYKGSGRLPFRPQTSGEPLGRAERFRDKTKNRGGFGVPPLPKEQPKKNENEEKSKDESNNAKTKPISSTTESKKSDENETGSFKGKTSESAFVPPRTENWDVADSQDTIAKEVKTEGTLAPIQKTAAEVKTEKPTTTEGFSGDKKPTEKEVVEKSTDGKKQKNNKEDKVPTTAPTKNNQYESKTGEKRERTMPNKEREQQNFSKSDSGDTKVEKYESKTGERCERIVPNKEREQQNFSKSDSGDTKVEKYESKTGERRERIVPNKEREQQNFSKSDLGDTKVEKRRETEIYRDGRHRQDDRRPHPRDETRREQPKRNDERKAPVKSGAENWDGEINSRAEERKGVQRENRDATRQSDRTQDHTDRRNNSYSRDRKDQRDQRDQDKSDQRNRNERNRTDQRERTDRRDRTDQRERTDRRDRTEQREGNDRRENTDRRDRTEQRERVDRRYRTEQSERQDRRDRTDQREGIDRRDRTEQSDRTDRRDKIKPVSNEKLESNVDKPRKPGVKGEEQNKDIQQNESIPQKQDANRESERTEKQDEHLSSMKKQSDGFTVGTLSPGGDRRRYNETRRGDASSRRGSHGGTRGMRGRGRGRVISSAKPIGKGSAASKNDDENDSEDYHSAHSSVDSDESDSEEVFDKQDDGRRDDKRPTRSYYSSSRSRGSYSSRGRGRGGSQITRSPRKQPEKPPRFQRQEARSASRGRGKSNRGGFSSKDYRDENISKNRDSRNSDEGPLPKKRPPDTSYSNEKDSDGSYRGRKAVRGGHSGNKNSFLAKKQQEVVEVSSRKGGGRFGAKSTIPAALTTHGRRAKNEPAPVDGDDNLEPPKKNPRRTEPQKVGIEHIDMSNIAGFIDIDDIAQPASEFEPASPQSDFVEVKSKRTQKEQRERAREEEERKRRELEKMMQDAMLKPKTNKSSLQNKQHSTSKPPRFARNTGVPSNVVSTLPEGNTLPSSVTPVAIPENNTITALASANVEQKRVSPLMLEKPSSPPPPPMFNAWTKPLSITPAKPPNEASAELPRITQPDPLAVGSGKPQRASGTQPKAEEPGLQIQLTLPPTFQLAGQRDIGSQNSESGMFSRVDKTGEGEPNVNSPLKKTSDENIAEQTESKKPDGIQSTGSNTRKEESKMNAHNVKTTESSVSDKNSENNKRQPTGNNWKSSRPPRFEKSVPGKRNTDGRRLKADTKDNGEPKSQPDTDKPREKNDGRPRSASRPRDVNKTQKAKPQVKNAKSHNSDENRDPNIERNSQDKTENEERQQNRNKRDSVELDVQSMSESLLDESPLGVHNIVETPKAGSGNASMVKIKTEDDIKMDFEMQEKMEAAKKAWDHSFSSCPIQTSQWNALVTNDENTESAEVSVVDQIPISAPEPEESSEPLVTTPRLKKPIAGEQQNVCKVKPQQQQQPVKPQPAPSEVPEEYPTATTRPVLDSPAQASYTVQPHQAAIFTSKPAPQGFTYSFEQQTLVPISHQYVQTDMSSIQRHHVSPVRPQTLHAASQSPPQRAATYPQGQSVSTPSPLSHQPLIQDSYRALMQPTALYSTNTYAGNQYFPISVVRPAAQPQFPATMSEDISNSMYTVQAPKSQNPSHGYEAAVTTTQQVFLPVEQQPYSDYMQPQRQHPVGFYSNNTNQANLGGMPVHVPKSVTFPSSDKQVQHQRDSRTPSGRQEQQYTPPGQSEMSKHVHAKPFQPPTSGSSGSATHQIAPNVHQIPTMSGQSNVTPAYHVNNAVLSMQATSATALQGSVSSSDHAGTSPIVTPAHALPVSRLSFHQFPGAVGSFPRQVQVPVQHLTPTNYPAGLTYRTTGPSYPTTTSVANQPGVFVHKPASMMRQLVTAGRGAPVPHRMPEPIQRPNKVGYHLSTLKEKQLNPQPRLKTVHPMPSRRAFNPVGAAQPQMAAYQFQALPRPQQPIQPQQQQHQQQQMFRNQQHQQMLSNVQQFFAEDKEIEHQRKQKQANQKREPVATTTSNSSGDKQKKRRQQIPDRRSVRTAQIPPQNRAKPSGPKQELIQQQMVGVTPPKNETKKVQPRLDLKTEQVEIKN